MADYNPFAEDAADDAAGPDHGAGRPAATVAAASWAPAPSAATDGRRDRPQAQTGGGERTAGAGQMADAAGANPFLRTASSASSTGRGGRPDSPSTHGAVSASEVEYLREQLRQKDTEMARLQQRVQTLAQQTEHLPGSRKPNFPICYPLFYHNIMRDVLDPTMRWHVRLAFANYWGAPAPSCLRAAPY